jgi:hypothetical protein
MAEANHPVRPALIVPIARHPRASRQPEDLPLPTVVLQEGVPQVVIRVEKSPVALGTQRHLLPQVRAHLIPSLAVLRRDWGDLPHLFHKSCKKLPHSRHFRGLVLPSPRHPPRKPLALSRLSHSRLLGRLPLNLQYNVPLRVSNVTRLLTVPLRPL